MSRHHDFLNVFRHLSLYRVWNLVLLKISYWFSRFIRRPIAFGSPFSLSIEPTTACNLACPECPSGLKQFTRATGKMDLIFHQRILQSVGKQVFYINYYFQGEPFLHPQFLELIKEAKKHRIYTATSTNAHFITPEKATEIVESGLDRMILSIDGLSQNSYEKYRINGQLNKVLDGAKALVEAKKRMKSSTPHLILQFLVVQHNEHEIDALYQLAKELEIDDVRLKTAQFYEYEKGNPLMPKNLAYSRYKLNSDGTYSLKYKTGNHCWRMWSSSVITWDGSVVPCCFDKDAKYILGSLQKNEFKLIWNDPSYQKFRYSVLHHRHQIDICTNCSEGAKVWV